MRQGFNEVIHQIADDTDIIRVAESSVGPWCPLDFCVILDLDLCIDKRSVDDSEIRTIVLANPVNHWTSVYTDGSSSRGVFELMLAEILHGELEAIFIALK